MFRFSLVLWHFVVSARAERAGVILAQGASKSSTS